ncbi:MAG TPA: hypothetical protein VEA38_01225 [Terriglobales bacterium]|nr:hypothetical protein [Terriglobales bacterium]
MDARRLIESLVTEVAPNATVAGVEEHDARCRITLAGTTGLLVGCDIPREVLERAEEDGTDRARVAAALKRCADDVVAPLPDARG